MLGLLPSEELIAPAQQALTSEGVEELKRFPWMWRQYEEGLAEGARQQRRVDILEVLVARFDPPASEYRRIEQALAALDDADRLDDLFQRAVRVGELAKVVAANGAA